MAADSSDQPKDVPRSFQMNVIMESYPSNYLLHSRDLVFLVLCANIGFGLLDELGHRLRTTVGLQLEILAPLYNYAGWNLLVPQESPNPQERFSLLLANHRANRRVLVD